jgi:hypothetical protein
MNIKIEGSKRGLFKAIKGFSCMLMSMEDEKYLNGAEGAGLHPVKLNAG